jgi:tol-pal system protein YbgF
MLACTRMNRAAIVGCVLIVLAAGCATRGSVRQVGEDVRAVQSEVAALRQSQEDLTRRLTEMTNANRAALTKADQLQSSITALRADVDRLNARAEATDAAIKDVQATLAVRATAPPPPPPAAPPPPGPPPVAAPQSAPEPARQTKQTRTSSAEASFTAGLKNFREHEYGQAVLDFLDVVTKHPGHELASTAQYLIGEAYYLQHDYRQAIAEFQRAVDWKPSHPKIPDALLKVGLCHSRLREAKQAQVAWRRIVREYPDSPAADEARTLLAGKKSPYPSARHR